MTVIFGTVASAKAKSKLRAMLDDPAILLSRSRQKSGNVFKRNQRNVETIAEAHKARAFHRRVDIERPGQHRRLIRHNPHAFSIEPRKSDNNVLGVVLLHLEEICVVHHRVDSITPAS